MQRVQWMQRVMWVSTSGPKSLSATARLFSSIAAAVEAIGHRLVLQVALAALVADRAIERMVDQQELHHALARLLAPARDLVWITMPSATGIAQEAIGFGDFSDLDQAHAAIAGDRQALVEAEMRHLDAGLLAGLQHRRARRHLDLLPSIVSFGMRAYSAARRAARRRRDIRAMRRSISGRKCRIRPCTGHAARIAQRADRVAFDLLGDVEQHVDLGDRRRCPRPCAP